MNSRNPGSKLNEFFRYSNKLSTAFVQSFLSFSTFARKLKNGNDFREKLKNTQITQFVKNP